MTDVVPRRKKLTKNFYEDEFICECDCCHFDNWIDVRVVNLLQIIRDVIQKPIKINSGARCTNHNQRIGGVPRSKHIVTASQVAKAVDIRTTNLSSEDRWDLVSIAMRYGMGGVGIAKTFIHIDIGERKAIWKY